MNDYHKYRPVPTTKQELIDAVEEACRIATLPSPDRFLSSLNSQLGILKFLARNLPEVKP